MLSIVFIDTEISPETNKAVDFGAIYLDKSKIHTKSPTEFSKFISGAAFLCGHNIIHHDLKYIDPLLSGPFLPIDTLYLSPLLFPRKPYHNLIKDDKIFSVDLNNPLNDSIKAMNLFYDEVAAFNSLLEKHPLIAKIYCGLLYDKQEFHGFFKYNHISHHSIEASDIEQAFKGMICTNVDIASLIDQYPIELAYTLALIKFGTSESIAPPWILKNYPNVERILQLLRFTPCQQGCSYCDTSLNIHNALKQYFGYEDFRKYNGENLQEQAVRAAVEQKSLIAIFPTGGGKSITFQLPAIMAGANIHGLTIVISPLQSLMKDQVDNLEKRGIFDAVTINGMLSPLERSQAINRVLDGSANILYISPEQLRSSTIERIILSRTIERFVIDEAHCFSAWGHDFRVDYLYIGTFIQNVQKKKSSQSTIPVSCFTATAKQNVISDIKDYFKRHLNIELELFATDAARKNLKYHVIYRETDEEKYSTLRELIQDSNCPTIVYTSRTKSTEYLAEKLNKDGVSSRPYHGKMDPNEKIANQEAFIRNEVQVIVATSAFGMGVDKENVELVIHYDISNSLENYIQEAGRAARDPNLSAKCYILYNENDLDKHFFLLNQTKLNISEIQQIWRAIKNISKDKKTISISPLELARHAGFDDSTFDIETRVKTALATLESTGYIKRGKNSAHVYATSILVKNMEEASSIIERSPHFNETQKKYATLIIQSLISNKNIAKASDASAQSRIDYISDTLGITKQEVIRSITTMRQDGLLADTRDLSAQILYSKNKALKILAIFKQLEGFLLEHLSTDLFKNDIKLINESALNSNIESSVKNIRTIIYYWFIKNYIQKSENRSTNKMEILPNYESHRLKEKYELRMNICQFVIEELYRLKDETGKNLSEEIMIYFSLLELFRSYSQRDPKASLQDIEDALLYLSKIGALSLEGGFLVIYNTMDITRLTMDNREQFKIKDYKTLSDFYKQKIQQIHIVGEYAKMVVQNYERSLEFVHDYFQIKFEEFVKKYFGKQREPEINRNVSQKKYDRLFTDLSDIQSEIIHDDNSPYIVVAAGPGSGKTLVLVHKLASLLLMEDIKQEQLLMLTFSRAAATEFKKRLFQLIGSAAHYVEIKTFHSYCFDLIGTRGNLEQADNIVQKATEMILNDEVEAGRIKKSVVVIDEAQDMDQHEYELIEALILMNDGMRVIAVGDDDQNIYEFRGSDTKYFKSFITHHFAKKYEMTMNYRSTPQIVEISNKFVQAIPHRMKTEPLVPFLQGDGEVYLNKYKDQNIEQALITDLLRHFNTEDTICILSNTNEECLKLASLLKRSKIPFKLIQANDGFQLYDLAEIRYFLKQIDSDGDHSRIPNSAWDHSKEKLLKRYQRSTCLENCIRLLDDFRQINPDLYRSDLDEFIRESHYDDFYQNDKGMIFLSTIHKSKGREFDQVYLWMNNETLANDEAKRKVFVGMTRAKNLLSIHYNNDTFDAFQTSSSTFSYDSNSYGSADEIFLQLSHKDIHLDYSKNHKDIILRLQSGDPLLIDKDYLYVMEDGQKRRVLHFSKKFINDLNMKQNKGYVPYKASVRFVVAWKPQNDDSNDEYALLLPDLYLKKS